MSYAGKVGTTLLFAHSPKDDMLAYFSLAPSRKSHLCRLLMQKFRESKADLDQFAEVYCDQQGITADSSLNESAQKSAKCEFIYNQCKPFQQQELVDAQGTHPRARASSSSGTEKCPNKLIC